MLYMPHDPHARSVFYLTNNNVPKKHFHTITSIIFSMSEQFYLSEYCKYCDAKAEQKLVFFLSQMEQSKRGKTHPTLCYGFP